MVGYGPQGMEWGQRMRSQRPAKVKLTKESSEGWEAKKQNLLPLTSLCSRIWTPSGRHDLEVEKLSQKRIHSETFCGGSWSRLRMLVFLAGLHWSLGMWCMYVEKVYWQRTGHIHHESISRDSQNELQSPQEGFDINPQPLDSSNLKAALQIGSAFLLPTTCISNIFLLGRTTLAPSEQADEEAGMCVKE